MNSQTEGISSATEELSCPYMQKQDLSGTAQTSGTTGNIKNF